MRTATRLLWAVFFLSCLAGEAAPRKPRPRPAPPTAAVVESVESRVAALKARGDEALLDGRAREALEHYDAALALTPSAPALLYNKARALEALERFHEAVRMLERFTAEAGPELKERVPLLDSLLASLRARTSALELKSTVDGAEVRVGDRVLGTTPLARAELLAGTVTLSVTHPAYHPVTRTVELPPAGVAVVEVAPSPRATTGLVRVRSTVPGAALRVDDVPRGTAPFEGYLPVGSHVVELRAEGHEPSTNSLVVDPSAPRELTVELRRTPGLHERWWFWTIIGVAAAGAATTAVLLTVERPAPPGSIGITSVGPSR